MSLAITYTIENKILIPKPKHILCACYQVTFGNTIYAKMLPLVTKMTVEIIQSNS